MWGFATTRWGGLSQQPIIVKKNPGDFDNGKAIVVCPPPPRAVPQRGG